MFNVIQDAQLLAPGDPLTQVALGLRKPGVSQGGSLGMAHHSGQEDASAEAISQRWGTEGPAPQ